jgi:hypothetical protein
MARPLSMEFPGALYHITSRGNARQRVFRDPRTVQRTWPAWPGTWGASGGVVTPIA